MDSFKIDMNLLYYFYDKILKANNVTFQACFVREGMGTVMLFFLMDNLLAPGHSGHRGFIAPAETWAIFLPHTPYYLSL